MWIRCLGHSDKPVNMDLITCFCIDEGRESSYINFYSAVGKDIETSWDFKNKNERDQIFSEICEVCSVYTVGVK